MAHHALTPSTASRRKGRKSDFSGLLLLWAGLLCVLGSVAAPTVHAREERTYVLSTATTGGTYYPVGIAMATVTKTRLAPEHGVSLAAISSAGSAENVKLLRDDEAQFAILQGIFSAWARDGAGPLAPNGPMENLRSVAVLWPNVEHFAVRKRFAGTGSIQDLAGMAGRRLAIGKRNSGAELSGRFILEALGIDPDTFTLVHKGYGPSADALTNGTVDAINTPAGVPVGAMTRAFASAGDRLTLLSFDAADLEKINATYELWSPVTLPAGTYPNQDAPVQTLQSPNLLAVRADVPEEDVYLITKTLYENLGLLGSIHAATKSMSLENALQGMLVPLHPGARRYFEEAGLTIPDRLKAQ